MSRPHLRFDIEHRKVGLWRRLDQARTLEEAVSAIDRSSVELAGEQVRVVDNLTGEVLHEWPAQVSSAGRATFRGFRFALALDQALARRAILGHMVQVQATAGAK